MEPPSPIQALADGRKSQSQRRNDTAIVLHQTAGNSLLTGQTQS